MSVYIVTRNSEIDQVFSSEAAAKAYIKEVGGWNIWKIIPTEIKDSFQPKLI